MHASSESSWSGSRRSFRGRINNQTMWLLLAILALAPIPLAGVLPGLWAIFATFMGLLLAVYSFRHYRLETELALPAKAYRREAICWGAMLVYLAVQILPLGLILPIGLSLADGSTLPLRQLSITPGTSTMLLVQAIGYATMAFLAAQISVRQSRARRFQVGLVIVVTAFAVYGLIALTQLQDTILGMEKWAYAGSATATFVNRNTFATFLSLGLVCAVALTINEVGTARQRSAGGFAAALMAAPAAAGAVLILTALFATQSRMGLFAGISGSLVVILLSLTRTERTAYRLPAILLTVLVAAGSIAWLYGQGVLDRLGSVDRDFDVRTDLYAQVWQLIMERPLLGYGGGSFEYAFPLVHQPPVSLDLLWDRAHSTYLTLWVEFGLVAGSLPMIAIGLALLRLVGHWARRATVSPSRNAAIGAIVVCAIHSLVDFSLEIQAVAYLFAAIVGAGLGSVYQPAARGKDT